MEHARGEPGSGRGAGWPASSPGAPRRRASTEVPADPIAHLLAPELVAAAVDQAAETILVTDATPVVLYANPAVTRSSGYRLDEVLGRNPRMFSSGLHDRDFYAGMWQQLVGGRSWHGVLVNRRKTGELYEEDTTITPVHDEDGVLVAYVAVKHDLGHDRAPERSIEPPSTGAARTDGDHEAVADVLRRVRPAATFEATAGALCQAVRSLDGIDGAMVMLLPSDEQAVQVAVSGIELPGQADGQPLAIEDVQLLVDLSAAGPWWLDLLDVDGPASSNPDISATLRDLGITATAYGPIRWEGRLIGLLAVATTAADAPAWMPRRLGALGELASFAGLLLGAQGDRYRRQEGLRSRLQVVIDQQAFHPVFQPVHDLTTGAVVGYEALTRFADGVRPDRCFAEAHTVGMGAELEAACVRAALASAAPLPSDRWLSVNFSPSCVIAGVAAEVLAGVERPIVLEITEHVEVESYLALARAVDELGPGVRVAVDDAGAGFASLRHILELRPHIVKLDIGLIHDIDRDPARQALAAGLHHFAESTGTELLAEGVETAAELAAVRDLGIDLAQGYHLGRPVPVDQL